jgi:hypothetical protein
MAGSGQSAASAPDLSTASKFQRWINSLRIEGCTLKSDPPRQPYRLVERPAFSHIVGRENTLRQVYGYLEERQQRRKTAQNPNGRQMNPLVALQSSPGGGKSTFLDVLAQHVLGLPVPGIVQVQVPEFLKNVVPIVITYNRGRRILHDVERDLVLRCIFSLFFTHDSEWNALREALSSVPSLPNFQRFVKYVREVSVSHALGLSFF